LILGAIAAQTDVTLVELAKLLERDHGPQLGPVPSGGS
jgi:hypothetical protein